MSRPPSPPPKPEGALWTAKEVAAFLSASTKWVDLKASTGELPSLKICGLLRFDPETVRRFAASGSK